MRIFLKPNGVDYGVPGGSSSAASENLFARLAAVGFSTAWCWPADFETGGGAAGVCATAGRYGGGVMLICYVLCTKTYIMGTLVLVFCLQKASASRARCPLSRLSEATRGVNMAGQKRSVLAFALALALAAASAGGPREGYSPRHSLFDWKDIPGAPLCRASG
jgi:hypothetical protein